MCGGRRARRWPDIVTKRLMAQHVQNTVVDTAALPVPGRREAVPTGGGVVEERVQQRSLGLVHDHRLPKITRCIHPARRMLPR